MRNSTTATTVKSFLLPSLFLHHRLSWTDEDKFQAPLDCLATWVIPSDSLIHTHTSSHSSGKHLNNNNNMVSINTLCLYSVCFTDCTCLLEINLLLLLFLDHPLWTGIKYIKQVAVSHRTVTWYVALHAYVYCTGWKIAENEPISSLPLGTRSTVEMLHDSALYKSIIDIDIDTDRRPQLSAE